MSFPLAVGLSGALAFGLAFALARLIAWCGPVDTPRDRGLHIAPTPTAGGLAIIAGVAAGLLIFACLHPGGAMTPTVAGAFGLAALLGLFGALDDIFDLDARAKLLAQLIVALGFALFVAHPAALPMPGGEVGLPSLVAAGGTALWVVVAINAVNFMDGSNGLIAGALAVVAGIVGAAALPMGAGVALLALAAACLGFLPANFPKAKVFMGDAGAQFLGALIAMLAVIAAAGGGRRAPVDLLAIPTALLPLLTDVFLTLIGRARRGSRLFDAHREHLYQRWFLAHGEDHAALAWRVWGVMAIYTAAAALVARFAPDMAWPALILGVASSVIGWLAIDRRLRPRG